MTQEFDINRFLKELSSKLPPSEGRQEESGFEELLFEEPRQQALIAKTYSTESSKLPFFSDIAGKPDVSPLVLAEYAAREKFTRLIVSADGLWLVDGARAMSPKVISLITADTMGKPVVVQEFGPYDMTPEIAWAPGAKELALISAGRLYLFSAKDVQAGFECKASYEFPQALSSMIKFNQRGDLLAVSQRDDDDRGSLTVFSLGTKDQRTLSELDTRGFGLGHHFAIEYREAHHVTKTMTGSAVCSFAFCPAKDVMVLNCSDGYLRLLSLSAEDENGQLKVLDELSLGYYIRDFSFFGDGNRFLAVSPSRAIFCIEIDGDEQSGILKLTREVPLKDICCVATHAPQGVCALSRKDGTIELGRIEELLQGPSFALQPWHKLEDEPGSLCFTDDGKGLVVGRRLGSWVQILGAHASEA